MLFNSIEFALFLPVVFLLYWSLSGRNPLFRNILIVAASYLFYGWWDWRFLSLLIFSTSTDYFIGMGLGRTHIVFQRKMLLAASIIVNLGLLCFFKYYNFFMESFVGAFTFFGGRTNIHSLRIILPVGISFYTFQTLSYTIDVYRKKIRPTGDLVAFAAFVSFFPQLVAGPIERAVNLLPQFLGNRQFIYRDAVDGLRQMLWGLFKKAVVADNCAHYADIIFKYSDDYSGSTLWLGAVLFAFQIYGDFSGYSDMAIGVSKLFGIKLQRNFAYPFFSRDIAEFWRRWHISLTTWFKDYIYIPLGGSRGSTWGRIRNTFIVFTISGLWHGANWTFVFWGVLHALFFLPLLLSGKNRRYLDNSEERGWLPGLREMTGMVVTFIITTFAWVLFRAVDIGRAYAYIMGMFSGTVFNKPELIPRVPLVMIGILLLFEWGGRHHLHALANLGVIRNRSMRWAVYYGLIAAVYLFGCRDQQFIYFQF